MPNPVVRSFPVYYNSKKMGFAYEKTFDINSGRTKLFGSDGYLTHSRGAATSGLKISMVVPLPGVDVDYLTDLLNQNDCEIGLPVNGRFASVTMALVSGSFKANTEKGVTEGDVTLEGGKPDIQ